VFNETAGGSIHIESAGRGTVGYDSDSFILDMEIRKTVILQIRLARTMIVKSLLSIISSHLVSIHRIFICARYKNLRRKLLFLSRSAKSIRASKLYYMVN